jgi:predicted MFS family arabinose efflux permease
MARRYLPLTAPGGVRAGRDGGRFDWIGWILLAIALLALFNGLVQLHDAGIGALPVLALVLLGLAVACGLGFIAHQHRVAKPLLNLALFRKRSFAMASLVAFIYGMALFGSTYLVPVFMQMALQLPPSQAGVVLLPAGIMLAITIPIAGRLADRMPIHRLVMAGLLLLALSFALMLSVGLGTALWLLMVWTAIGRIGLGFVLPTLNLGAMRGLDLKLVAQGSSTINFVRQLGGAVGVNLIGIFLEWRLHVHGVQTATAANAREQLPAFHESFAVLALVIGGAVFAARLMRVEPNDTSGAG